MSKIVTFQHAELDGYASTHSVSKPLDITTNVVHVVGKEQDIIFFLNSANSNLQSINGAMTWKRLIEGINLLANSEESDEYQFQVEDFSTRENMLQGNEILLNDIQGRFSVRVAFYNNAVTFRLNISGNVLNPQILALKINFLFLSIAKCLSEYYLGEA